MNYLGELTSQLRYKNYSTDEIVDILQDVKSHAHTAGAAPAESFGEADEYPKLRKITTFKVLLNVAYGVVLLGWVVVSFVLRLTLGAQALPRPWVIDLVAIAGCLLVCVVGQLYARRVPRPSGT